MPSKARCNLSAFWGPRRETPAALAQRWLAVVRHLQTIDPVLAAWYRGVDGRGVPVPLEARAVEALIADAFTDTGYRFNTRSDIAGRGRRVFELHMNAGDSWFNVVTFGTEFFSDPDPAMLRYDLFRSALLAIAEVFEVENAQAYPNSLREFRPRPPSKNLYFPISWLSYIGPRQACLVTPPTAGLVERRPNGGVLMVATAELFDVNNPAHMAAARAIESAVAPLSRTPPWELGA